MQFVKAHKCLIVFLASALLGCIAFIAIYGIRILDVTKVDWILAINDDFAQSYLGWCFYRASEWFWPLGLLENAAYPNLTPILYIDSIPLFDLLFKVLSPVLPQTFQFFGIWGLVCFALSGGVSGSLLYRLTQSVPYSILASLFFTLASFVVQRLYTHTALAANWVILLAILIIATSEMRFGDRENPSSKGGGKGLALRAASWFGCCFLAVGVNIYYVPIIGIMLLVYSVFDCVVRRRIVEGLCWLVSALVGTVFAFYLFGGFYHMGSTTLGATSLGYLSANLNTLINPMEYGGYLNGFSTFMPSLPMATTGQYEGFAYLGAGLILLVVIAIVGVLTCGTERRKEIFGGLRGIVVAVIGDCGGNPGPKRDRKEAACSARSKEGSR